jgi:putative toxin-antitoxin system antitoxin component (TIGR02293 family)
MERPGIPTPSEEEATSEVGAMVWRRVDRASALFRASRMQRVKIVKKGVPARYTGVLAAGMRMSKDKFYSTVGLPRATVDRKVRANKRLNLDESERVVGIARLVGQAQSLVQDSGGPADFDGARWLAEWSSGRCRARREAPGEFMDTSEGRALVSDLLAQQQSGASA